MEMEAGTGTAAGRDSVFVETTFEDQIDGLLRSSANAEGRLIQMAELAKEILAAGREEMEANNGLRRELERVRPVAEIGGDEPIRRTFDVGSEPDREIQAATILLLVLEELDADARRRVMYWAASRFAKGGA
jgi:hypothetical protein